MIPRDHRSVVKGALCLAVLLWAAGPAGAAKEIDPNWLSLTDCPMEPGCAALILLDQTELSNEKLQARLSRRRAIKIFTDEGAQRHADLMILALRGREVVKNITGRTILPDGASIPLPQENIFSKVAWRRGRYRINTRSARFPGIVRGSIVEYAYDLVDARESNFVQWTWDVQDELPVLEARLTLKAGEVNMVWQKAGAEPVSLGRTSPKPNVQVFTITGVPSLPSEPFQPPAASLRARVHFFPPDVPAIWIPLMAEELGRRAGIFLEKTGGIPEKVRALVRPDSSPLEKARTLYQFVQENISPEERDEPAPRSRARNAGEVMASGQGSDLERAMLFLALAKEAGLECELVAVASRDHVLLDHMVPDPSQFDAFAVAMRNGDQWIYLDPATRHCPFGMVSPEKESAGEPNALHIRPRAGSTAPYGRLSAGVLSLGAAPARLVPIPLSPASKNVLMREAVVKVAADGSAVVEGTEQATGHLELQRRVLYRDLDDGDRREAFAARLLESVPRMRLDSLEFEDLDLSEAKPLIRFRFTLPDLGASVGDRLVLTPSLFNAWKPALIADTARRTPVYLPHTLKTVERITLELPSGYVVQDLPSPVLLRDGPLRLVSSFEQEEGRVVYSRRLEIDAVVWDFEATPKLIGFFRRTQEHDRSPVVLMRQPTLSEEGE